jgi:hypothetical protein
MFAPNATQTADTDAPSVTTCLFSERVTLRDVRVRVRVLVT